MDVNLHVYYQLEKRPEIDEANVDNGGVDVDAYYVDYIVIYHCLAGDDDHNDNDQGYQDVVYAQYNYENGYDVNLAWSSFSSCDHNHHHPARDDSALIDLNSVASFFFDRRWTKALQFAKGWYPATVSAHS